MIQHTVAFALHAKSGSDEEMEFLNQARQLANITGVRDFKVHRQTSPKNSFTFGLTMFFETAEDYDSYNNHPDHVAFVQNVWLSSVSDFLEIDYEEMA